MEGREPDLVEEKIWELIRQQLNGLKVLEDLRRQLPLLVVRRIALSFENENPTWKKNYFNYIEPF